jgi:hypothetical protein
MAYGYPLYNYSKLLELMYPVCKLIHYLSMLILSKKLGIRIGEGLHDGVYLVFVKHLT